jgi:quercetin dioxygenase-like cupin family protein
MPLVNLKSIESKELVPGFHARMVHSENMTLAYWDIEEGSLMPDHSHPHEQVANVIEGTLELVVDEEAHQLTPGNVFMIPSNIPHSGKALTACKVIDVFYPVREDFR